MGFFGVITGLEPVKAAGNAILANDMLPYLDKQTKRKIVEFVAKGFGRNTFDIVKYLNSSNRVVQLNFVALGCYQLGIDPKLDDGIGWRHLKNPKDASFTKLKHIEYLIEDTEKRTNSKVNWPGDEVRIDFSDWYSAN